MNIGREALFLGNFPAKGGEGVAFGNGERGTKSSFVFSGYDGQLLEGLRSKTSQYELRAAAVFGVAAAFDEALFGHFIEEQNHAAGENAQAAGKNLLRAGRNGGDEAQDARLGARDAERFDAFGKAVGRVVAELRQEKGRAGGAGRMRFFNHAGLRLTKYLPNTIIHIMNYS